MKKYSKYSLIGFIILISINILSEIVPQNPTRILRIVLSFINWFVFIPTIFITLYFTIVSLKPYIKNQFKSLDKYFLFLIPFVVYFIYYVINFSYIVFIKKW